LEAHGESVSCASADINLSMTDQARLPARIMPFFFQVLWNEGDGQSRLHPAVATRLIDVVRTSPAAKGARIAVSGNLARAPEPRGWGLR